MLWGYGSHDRCLDWDLHIAPFSRLQSMRSCCRPTSDTKPNTPFCVMLGSAQLIVTGSGISGPNETQGAYHVCYTYFDSSCQQALTDYTDLRRLLFFPLTARSPRLLAMHLHHLVLTMVFAIFLSPYLCHLMLYPLLEDQDCPYEDYDCDAYDE